MQYLYHYLLTYLVIFNNYKENTLGNFKRIQVVVFNLLTQDATKSPNSSEYTGNEHLEKINQIWSNKMEQQQNAMVFVGIPAPGSASAQQRSQHNSRRITVRVCRALFIL